MKTLALLAAGLLLCSACVFAGDVITNDTGEDATGLRVVFTAPVLITAFGDVLTTVDPQMLSYEFVFSGGIVEPWGSHWFNYSPVTASIVEYEWLTEIAMSVADIARVPLAIVETFPVTLTSSSGDTMNATVRRSVSQGQIPFVVDYAVVAEDEDSMYQWTYNSSQHQVEGAKARFVLSSNAESVPITLDATSGSSTSYRWSDALDLSLHNLTEITLDATQFVPEAEIAAVTWTARNGDPDDAQTFPIADPTASITTLVSEWPNVLTINCEIQKQDGSVIEKTVDALVYFRDGTPFEIRSIASTVNEPFIAIDVLTGMIATMLSSVKALGFNAVTTAINWWYGYPDESGAFTVHPLYDSTWSSRGGTIGPDQLDTYLSMAAEEGFQFHVQTTQFSYKDDEVLSHDYHQSGWGAYAGFRNSDGFLYGNGQGYENMLLEYIPVFTKHSVVSVFLGAEVGNMEKHGGEKTRSFMSSVIQSYREAGYEGGLSYALSYRFSRTRPETPPYYSEHLDPSQCGIPWEDMDYVSLTFYPKLTDSFDASTPEMYQEARRQVQQYLVPLHETYDKPLFIEDFYCFAHDGCAIRPVDDQWRMEKDHDPEEQRRWHTAWLRALAEENILSPSPWIKGITMYDYWLNPWISGTSYQDRAMKAYVNAAESDHLRLLARVFFRDVPLEY